MNNINDLRTELSDVFAKLKEGNLDVKTAEALNNTAGKIISSVIAELKYRDITGNESTIPFMEYRNDQEQ